MKNSDICRNNPDDYVYSTCNVGEDGVVVVESAHAHDPGRKLRHRLTPDGGWTTGEL